MRAQDAWEKEVGLFAVIDDLLAGDDSVKFAVRVDQTWSHPQLVSYLARIMGKVPSQITTTDSQGAHWRYPEDRLRANKVVVTVVPPTVPQVDLLGSLEYRGGARTISMTLPFQPMEDQGQDEGQHRDQEREVQAQVVQGNLFGQMI